MQNQCYDGIDMFNVWYSLKIVQAVTFCGKAICQVHKIHRLAVLSSLCLPLYV